jgi:hypothetical protein
MTEKQKLILGLMQIDSLLRLLDGNEYQQYLSRHIMQLRVELNRQLSHYGKTTY